MKIADVVLSPGSPEYTRSCRLAVRSIIRAPAHFPWRDPSPKQVCGCVAKGVRDGAACDDELLNWPINVRFPERVLSSNTNRRGPYRPPVMPTPMR